MSNKAAKDLLEAIIKSDRVAIPSHAKTPADYVRIHGCGLSEAQRAMRILADKHGWKSAKSKGRVYYWKE
jgi:hypothetical protein